MIELWIEIVVFIYEIPFLLEKLTDKLRLFRRVSGCHFHGSEFQPWKFADSRQTMDNICNNNKIQISKQKIEFWKTDISYCELQFSSFQSLNCVRLFVTAWTAARQASLSITNSRSPSKPMSIVSVTPSNHCILCCPLLQWIFSTQGLNARFLRLVCWQVGSLPPAPPWKSYDSLLIMYLLNYKTQNSRL